MPRIRTVKPEFFTSPSTAKLSPRARLLFIAMWCWADDYGKGETNLNGLLGMAFPESDEMERKDVQSLCKEVQSACNVEFYVVEERAYYAIPSWDKHQKTQRQAKSKIPDPDDPRATPDPRFHAEVEQARKSEEVQSIRNEAQSLEREQGKGTGEQEHMVTTSGGDRESEMTLLSPEESGPSHEDLFRDFWKHWPRKVKKPEALAAFLKAAKREKPLNIIDGAQRYAADPNLPETQFIPHPATWLNNDQWNDGPLPARANGRQSTAQRRQEAFAALAERWNPAEPAGEIEQ